MKLEQIIEQRAKCEAEKLKLPGGYVGSESYGDCGSVDLIVEDGTIRLATNRAGRATITMCPASARKLHAALGRILDGEPEPVAEPCPVPNPEREFIRKCGDGMHIVPSGALSTYAIAQAQACRRFYVDPDTNLGWAIMPNPCAKPVPPPEPVAPGDAKCMGRRAPDVFLRHDDDGTGAGPHAGHK